MRAKKARAVFQFKVSLRDVEPPVWRRIQVTEDTKLPRLHRILQLLFNWEDYHLHEFVAGQRVYGVPDPDDALYERKISDERLVPLNRIVDHVGDTIAYAYDFGDAWQHDIVLEAILLPDPEHRDPEHRQHADLLTWRGPFDPEAFSLARINAPLKKTFYRRPRI